MTADGMVWRAGGFFQDPQKAGGFLAALLAFKVVLLVRGRFHVPWLRMLVWCAVLAGVAALFLTVSRAAIMSFLLVSTLALVAANRWPGAIKVMGVFALVLLGVSLVLVPQLWISVLPGSFANRLGNSHEELMIRVDIWMDTWDMFKNHPVTGIGFSGFQQYLLDTRPMVTNYYGIGVAEGVPYIPNQPESGYFKILYEGGILGTLAVLVLIGATLRRAFVGIASAHVSADERSQVIAALAGLAAFAITFATLFTTVDPRMLALFAILLAVVWQPSVPQSSPARRS
jgi:O-antigen ligase